MEQRGVHWGSLVDLLRANTLALVLFLSLKYLEIQLCYYTNSRRQKSHQFQSKAEIRQAGRLDIYL